MKRKKIFLLFDLFVVRSSLSLSLSNFQSDQFVRFNSLRHKLKSCPASAVFLTALKLRRHSNVHLNTRKEIFSQVWRMTSSYLSQFFVLILSAKVLWYFWHSCPIAPEVVKMSGVQVPCSTWITRGLYCAFFSVSCFRMTLLTMLAPWPSLNLLARTSNRASSAKLADPRYPFLFITCWSSGSISPSWHIDFVSSASKSLMLSCLAALIKPPLWNLEHVLCWIDNYMDILMADSSALSCNGDAKHPETHIFPNQTHTVLKALHRAKLMLQVQ